MLPVVLLAYLPDLQQQKYSQAYDTSLRAYGTPMVPLWYPYSTYGTCATQAVPEPTVPL